LLQPTGTVQVFPRQILVCVELNMNDNVAEDTTSSQEEEGSAYEQEEGGYVSAEGSKSQSLVAVTPVHHSTPRRPRTPWTEQEVCFKHIHAFFLLYKQIYFVFLF
jgi:hypothetical protein